MSITQSILKVDDLKDQGFYWMADKTDRSSAWTIMYLDFDEVEAVSDETPSQGWFFGESEEFCTDEVQDYHVFIGPIPVPEIAVPFEPIVESLKAVPVFITTDSGKSTAPVVAPLLKVVTKSGELRPPALSKVI